MAKLSKEEYLDRIKTYVGDRTDDETLAFVEDMTDSWNDEAPAPAEPQTSEWETKYIELAKKYRDRFLTVTPAPAGPTPTPSGETIDIIEEIEKKDDDRSKTMSIKDIVSVNIERED